MILEFSQLLNEETASTSDALTIARKYLKKHLAAFEELAK